MIESKKNKMNYKDQYLNKLKIGKLTHPSQESNQSQQPSPRNMAYHGSKEGYQQITHF